MSEGRVGTLTNEYMIKDQQGNVRVSFENNAGTALVRQENSYYPFGLIMPGSVTPTSANKNLYNGGSEWQDDFGNLPDLQQTFYRNYDGALGRFIGVDPVAEADMSTYHYAANNPVMFNDPLGDQTDYSAFWNQMISRATDKNSHGGYWSHSTGFKSYDSDLEGFYAGSEMMQRNKAWGLYEGWATSYQNGATFYNDFFQGGASTNVNSMGYVTSAIVRINRNSDGVEIGGYAAYAMTFDVGNGKKSDGSKDTKNFIGSKDWNTISNNVTGFGFSVGAAEYQLGRALERRMTYQFTKAVYEGWKSPIGSTSFKTIIGQVNISTKFAKTAARTLKIGGAALSAAGVVITTAEILNGNKKLVGEGGLDLVMGGIGFVPGWGWAVSGLYFGGKYILQETGNDFWNK